jgi:hypothetical protein
LQVLNARSESEFEQIFVTVEQQRIGAMVVTSDTMVSNESATLGRVPTTKQLYFTRCVLDWRTGFIEYDYWAVAISHRPAEDICASRELGCYRR